MSLKVNKGNGGDFEQVPEGQYVARCYSIIDIGTQQINFQGETKYPRQVVITWELLDDEVKMKDGRPFVISKTYTASLHEKSRLYADLNAWRGKKFTEEELEDFDLTNVLGAYAQLQVVHEESKNGKTYANVNALMAYKGAKPTPVNSNVSFDIDEPDAEVYNGLRDYLKLKIQAAPEWKAPKGAVEAKQADGTAVAPSLPKSDDVVIKDLDASDEINLDDIPF
jgi:hypothetical protein